MSGLQARRAFPLDQKTYTGEGLEAHLLADHPFCQFCSRHFYDAEEYFLHNRCAAAYHVAGYVL